MPRFDVQAPANCVVKSFEPGCWIRFGATHQQLYEQLLSSEGRNTVELATYCQREDQDYQSKLFSRLISLAKQDNISSVPVLVRTYLQVQLKTRRKQRYQFLLSNTNRDPRSPLISCFVARRGWLWQIDSLSVCNIFMGTRKNLGNHKLYLP
jgi:hypothetical protein